MRIVISESFRGNLTALIPINDMSCMELMTGFLSDSRIPESAFSRQCRAAKFIFEDVRDFHPQAVAEGDFRPELIRGLKRIATSSEDGTLISLEDWRGTVERELKDSFSGNEISNILTSCLPSHTLTEDCVILSQDPFITEAHIQQRNHLSKEALLYLLATAGVDIVLPSIVAKNNEDIDLLKREFEEERLDYLLYMNKSLDLMLAAASGSSPDLTSIYEFAEDKFAIDLRLKSKKIAAIVGKKRKRVVDSIFSEFLNQASTIAAAAIRLDFVGAGQALFKSLLSAANGERDTLKAAMEYKEAAYIYRISSLKA